MLGVPSPARDKYLATLATVAPVFDRSRPTALYCRRILVMHPLLAIDLKTIISFNHFRGYRTYKPRFQPGSVACFVVSSPPGA